MAERINTEDSAYDYVIKGKEVPPEVHKATLARINTPYLQYRRLIKEGKPIFWIADTAPAGSARKGMEGGVPIEKEP